MIIQSFLVDIQKGNDGQLTCAEIARYLRVTPSTKLRIILAEMVEDDLITARKVLDHGIAGFRRIYKLPGGYALKSLETAKTAAFGKKKAKPVSDLQQTFFEALL